MKTKQTLKQYFSDIRNYYHAFISLTLGYDITLAFFSNREKFPISWEYWNNSLYPIVGGVIVGIVSALWERRQDKIRNGASDVRDIYNGIIMAIVGGYISLFYGNLFIALTLTILSVLVIVKNYKK